MLRKNGGIFCTKRSAALISHPNTHITQCPVFWVPQHRIHFGIEVILSGLFLYFHVRCIAPVRPHREGAAGDEAPDRGDDNAQGWHFSTHLILQWSIHQVMTAGMVHVTNLTTREWQPYPRRRAWSTRRPRGVAAQVVNL